MLVDYDILNLARQCINTPHFTTRDEDTRSGVGHRSCLGASITWDITTHGIPLIYLRRLFTDQLVGELAAFIAGDTTQEAFNRKGCTFWDPWAKNGSFGPIYGKQWDLPRLYQNLRDNPHSRQHVTCAWPTVSSSDTLSDMVLPPCHFAFQVHVYKNYGLNHMSLTWFQRSCDVLIGLPYNIASYAVLLCLLAREHNCVPHMVTGLISDAHVYDNQHEGFVKWKNRWTNGIDTYKPVHLTIGDVPSTTDRDAWKALDKSALSKLIVFDGYNPGSHISIPVTV